MNHVDTSQLKDCGEVISLDIDNRSCCGRQMFVSDDKLEAACIVSVLHECFSEYYNLSVVIWSCLTLSFVGHDCL